MSEEKKERCTNCDSETGKAGRSEDSLFFEEGTDQEIGPLCEDCYRLANTPPWCNPDSGVDMRYEGLT